MAPTRRGFFGRITGGLVALLGGKRAAVTQETPLAVPDEWLSLIDSASKNSYSYIHRDGLTIEEFANLKYRRVQVPFHQESMMAAPVPDPKDAAQAALDACGVKPGQIYRHYKGGLYSVVTTAIKEDTLEPLVVYKSNANGTVWVRTLENWDEAVEKPVAYIANDRETITQTVERVPRFSRVKE